MAEQFEQLWQRFRAFPRAIQWALIAGVCILVFVIWNDYIKAIGDEWALAADRIERQVAEVRNSVALEDDFESMKDTIRGLGPVHVPASEQAATTALNDVVNNLLKEYRNSITNQQFNRAAGDRLRKGSLHGIIGAQQVGKKLTGELEFDAPPEIATAILAKLESSPDIESVTEVRFTKLGGREVGVKLKLEAWVVVRDTSRRS